MSIAEPTTRTLWTHQESAIAETIEAIDAGETAICLTSPTGGGKTLIAESLISARPWRVAVYTNRRMMVSQLTRSFEQSGISHGVRASGHDPALLRDVQICSIQTERQRVYATNQWDLHAAQLVLIDEAHLQKEATAQQIIADHRAAGASVVGLTATPLGLGGIYDRLIVAGKTSELRRCGALVPCQIYAPDEPETAKYVKKVPIGQDFSEPQIRKMIMVQGVFGRIYQHWLSLNPDARPTILFAPGVKESIWFAEQFRAKGVKCAHIDGANVWLDGESYPTSQEVRDDVIAASKAGDVKVICNRFVMREGVDLPWLYHGIFATVFGSLQSYLQSGGRLLRSHPSLDHVICQDHGGNYHRHGSLNSDREWSLELTDHIATAMRAERMREKKESEPIVCPNCSAMRLSGPTCHKCGHTHSERSRMVVQHNGALKKMQGDVYRPRPIREKADTRKLWEGSYHQARKSKNEMTFNQAYGFFHHKHWYCPPKTLPLMPINEMDWFKRVKDVPRERLR